MMHNVVQTCVVCAYVCVLCALCVHPCMFLLCTGVLCVHECVVCRRFMCFVYAPVYTCCGFYICAQLCVCVCIFVEQSSVITEERVSVDENFTSALLSMNFLAEFNAHFRLPPPLRRKSRMSEWMNVSLAERARGKYVWVRSQWCSTYRQIFAHNLLHNTSPMPSESSLHMTYFWSLRTSSTIRL